MPAEKRWPESEAVLAQAVVGWLREYHWEVYQEVQIYSGGSVADIVAVQGRLVWVIECKKTLCFELLGQGENWTEHAHYTSVCVPRVADRVIGLTTKILNLTGMGLVRADEYGRVWEAHKPRINRRADATTLLKALREEHKTFAQAGTDSGRRWTPFLDTCSKIRKRVEELPGIEMRELIASVETHYATPASARANIKVWAEAGKIPGVKIIRAGRRLRLYPEGHNTAQATARPEVAGMFD